MLHRSENCAREAAYASPSLLAAVLRAATEYSIVGTDLRGVIDVFNDGAARMLGYTPDEMLGHRSPLCFHDPAEVAARALALGVAPGIDVFVSAARAAHAETREWTYIRKDGARLPVSLTVTGRHAEDGALNGYLGIARDLTAEKATEAERVDLERWKDEFLANVSHDLRTPITAIKAGINVVLENEPAGTTAAHRRMFRIVDQAADRMAAMVEDLLELNRLGAGRVALQPERCDLRQLARRAARIIEPLARARGQRVAVSLPRHSVPVFVDVTRLERAVLNLLGNAHQHGRRDGEIHVSVKRAAGNVLLSVADDGPGIPPSERERIFLRFYRGSGAEDPASTDQRGSIGNGLGLPIARRLVELHGGRLTLESEPGCGATFRISLPPAPARRAVPPVARPTVLANTVQGVAA